MLHLLLIGLISILGQVVLLRELQVASFGIELIYVFAMGAWMLWNAAGAAVGQWPATGSGRALGWLFLALSAILTLEIPLIRASKIILGGIKGAYLPLHQQVLVIAVVLALPAWLLGSLFRSAARDHISGGGSLAGAYAIESAGGLAGGLLATLFLHFGLRNLSIGLICSLTAAIAAWKILGPRPRRAGNLSAAGLIVALAVMLGKASALDFWTTAWTHENLILTRDSPYGRIAVTASENLLAVYQNDAIAFSTEETDSEILVHLAAIQHPAPESILILGGNIPGTVLEALKHSPRQIDCVQLDAELHRSIALRLPTEQRAAIEAPRVRIHIADPRRFLERAGSYDLVLLDMPEPDSGQTNRFFTREFFQACRFHLNSQGILALRLAGGANIWTPLSSLRAASIWRALQAGFPNTVALPAEAGILLASAATLARETDVLELRLRQRQIRARLVSPAFVRYLYRGDRYAEAEKMLRETEAPPNTDQRPICYQYSALLWLSKFFPALAGADPTRWGLPPQSWKYPAWIGTLSLLVLLAGARRLRAARASIMAGVAGFAGMVYENAVLLFYQAKRGILYQDIGLLLTCFMAGLALGSGSVARWNRISSPVCSALRKAALIAAFALLCLMSARGISAGIGAAIALAGSALAAGGFLVGALFAESGTFVSQDAGQAAGRLYAADLAGGALGAFCGSLFLAPLIGLADSIFCLVPVLAALLILV